MADRYTGEIGGPTGWCFPAKLRKLITEKGMDSGQAEMGEPRTVCEQRVDSLCI